MNYKGYKFIGTFYGTSKADVLRRIRLPIRVQTEKLLIKTGEKIGTPPKGCFKS